MFFNRTNRPRSAGNTLERPGALEETLGKMQKDINGQNTSKYNNC